VDQNAPSDHVTAAASLAYDASQNLQFWAKGGYFWEQQNGGTPLSSALVRSGDYSAGATFSSSSLGTFDLAFFGHVQDFKQNRSRINATRTIEVPAARQDVPSDDQGLTLVWSSRALPWGGTHRLSFGIELRRIHGTSNEDLFPATITSGSILQRVTGGNQAFLGVFVQDSYQIFSALELIGALRFDAWRNFHASQTTEDASGTHTETAFSDRSDNQLSPKLGARYRILESLTLRAAGYTAFRAPTLNELYRPFQVGTILTAANDQLGPETLRGAEVGIELNPRSGLVIRGTGFWNVLNQPITNVTLPAPLPDGSQRKRENLGQARIRGVEVDAGWHFFHSWTAALSYTFADSRVTSAPGVPQLVGLRLAQDPVHRASASLTFDNPTILTATVLTRIVGLQFEDDLNQLPMPGFLIFDLAASRRIGSSLELYAAIENLFNRQYLVGRAGIDTIGQPFTVRLGLRLHL
jgi:outer membrane receptor protein involved in Fe transport